MFSRVTLVEYSNSRLVIHFNIYYNSLRHTIKLFKQNEVKSAKGSAEMRGIMAEINYHEQVDIDNAVKLRSLLATLPRFCKDFFRGIEPTTSSRTRIAYAYDLRIFFDFLAKSNPLIKNTPITELRVDILDEIMPLDIEEYLDYLSYYNADGKKYMNKENGKKRKLVALRSFYNYYYKKQIIRTNPPSLVNIPKLHEKEIVRLEIDEVARLLDEVESGDALTKKQQVFHEKTKLRDLAIMTLLLGTGIRVSECVGLDINDVDFENNGIKIIRKGGNEVVIYFGDEVRDALLEYLEERKQLVPATGHENALFLSMQMKRLNVRSVENLVKKYASTVTKLKTITPHKLRSTYGTSLYRETGDIYLVADVLGHKDVNTTKKHYAALEDSRRRQAAKVVKLREKE
jgi:site-specific recombinase XerD